MRLELTKPLAFFDIESTGSNRETDRIIDLAISTWDGAGIINYQWRLNPDIPIPERATAIHGIADIHVMNKPGFASVANKVLDVLTGCDLAGFNIISFDVPMLYNEFQRCGITWDYSKHRMVDAGVIFKRQEARTLSAAMQFYCGEDHTGAHTAAADVRATMAVFMKQMERYQDLPATVEELHSYSCYDKPLLDISGKFTYNTEGDIIFNFGQRRGELAKLNLDYVDWMYNKANFAPDTRRVCEQLLEQHTSQ